MENINSIPQKINDGFRRFEKEDVLGEDWFFNQLDKLPQELSSKWRYEYESLDDTLNSDFFSRFNNFLSERERIVTGVLKIVSETPATVVDEINLLGEQIISEYGNQESFLGEGRTAKVYIHPVSPSVCIKFIKDSDSYTKTDLPLYKEFEILRNLQNLKVGGVRTPVPYFENASGRHMYGMERIRGNTLVQILEKPSENKDLIKLAKTLDRKMALENIVNFVEAMHDKCKITHNDLEIINIMLGYDGNLYIIDFGKSKFEEIGEDHELYRDADIKTVKSAIQEFFDRIDNIEIN